MREKGAQVRGRAVGEVGDRRRRAVPFRKEGEELTRVAAVSLDRMRRHAPLCVEPAKPRADRGGQVGRGGEGKDIGRRHAR